MATTRTARTSSEGAALLRRRLWRKSKTFCPTWASTHQMRAWARNFESLTTQWRKQNTKLPRRYECNEVCYKFRRLPEMARDNEEICVAACDAHFDAYEFCSKRMREKRGLAILVCQRGGYVVEHASHALRQDPEVALAALSNDGDALEFLPKFADEREFVTVAVLKTAGALQFASRRLQEDKTLLMAARYQHGEQEVTRVQRHASKLGT